MNNKTARSIPQIIIGNNSIATIDRTGRWTGRAGKGRDRLNDLLDPDVHLLDLDLVLGIILELFIPFG